MKKMMSLMAAITALICIHFGHAAAFDFEIKFGNFGITDRFRDAPELLTIYQNRNFKPIWTSGDAEGNDRLVALIEALRSASSHGLPFGNTEVQYIYYLIALPRNDANIAKAEAEISRLYFHFASSLKAGAVDPASVANQISRQRIPPNIATLFAGIIGPNPAAYIHSLAPATHQYLTMRKELKRLDLIIDRGGWGHKVDANLLQLGDTGPAVVQLRNRLIRMGYMSRTPTAELTNSMVFAIKRFQEDHGLDPDGAADAVTIDAINVEPQQRQQQVIVALERERWLNQPLGEEYVRVNIADFYADLISEGKPVFSTRVVVGQSKERLQTPEFSDEMTHFVINPTWYVPRSIAVREILPQLKQNPSAEPLLEMFSQEQGIIDRDHVDFGNYSAANFPYAFKQPPGPKNALGQVKFMFPNRFNVYMHDTPQRSLFQQETRNFSHGCIRLHRAADFANFLLSRMVDDPQSVYGKIVRNGRESTMLLPKPLPVHITYRTAFVGKNGRVQYRADIYGRDQAVYTKIKNF